MAEIQQKWPWPRNVGTLGTFPEEVHAQKRLEKNPDAAPMPQVAPTNLLEAKRSSDSLRIGDPHPISEDPFEATQLELNHVVLRRLLMKRGRTGWRSFADAVEDQDLKGLPGARRDQMRVMLRRESAMLDLLDQYNGMAEMVYARLLSESKG